MDPLLPGPLWMVGSGHMGSAMLAGWMSAGVDPARVSVVRPSGKPVGHGIRVLTDFPEDEVPAIIVLAMKPQQLGAVSARLAPILDPATILISILAGVELETLRARFERPRTIVRAMPNLPVRLGRGVIGLFSDSRDATARAEATGLMAALGHAEWIEPEPLLDLLTALGGSGPAFFLRFIDALADAAADAGMPKDQALRFALATAEGTAALAAHEKATPAELARRVTSPGGTTEAGLRILDEDEALSRLVARTFDAARQRSLELAAQARAED